MNVLLPIDADDERATLATETITTLPHAAEAVHVTILNVQKEVEIHDDSVVSSEDWYDPDTYPPSVEETEAILQKAGIAVEKRRMHGDPAESILETAADIDADMIVMTGRKRTPVGKVLFGSVTQSVLLNAETPVTVAPK